MEKAKLPTSTNTIFCDYFDTALTSQFHDADGESKLQITIQDIDDDTGDSGMSISLYKEDVEMMAEFLKTAAQFVKPRL